MLEFIIVVQIAAILFFLGLVLTGAFKALQNRQHLKNLLTPDLSLLKEEYKDGTNGNRKAKDKENIGRLEKLYLSAGVKMSWRQFVIANGIIVVAVTTAVFMIFQSSVLSATALIVAQVAIILGVLIQARKQRQKLTKQFPPFLIALSNAMEAGYSLQQAFEFVGQEMMVPLKTHMDKIIKKLSYNIPLEKALQDFSDEVGNADISFFTESLNMQIHAGGNIIKFLKKLSRSIEEKMKLQNDVRSYTSQGKLSGLVIAGIWPFALAIFAIFLPEHTNLLFHTLVGQMLFATAVILELIGFVWIWKVVNPKL